MNLVVHPSSRYSTESGVMKVMVGPSEVRCTLGVKGNQGNIDLHADATRVFGCLM